MIVNENQNSLTDIFLQIKKKVYYFPLKIGNKWEYKVYRTSGDGYGNYTYKGKEVHEIVYISSDKIYFNMDVYFTGKKITVSDYGAEKDTLYITNKKRSYKLKFEEGYIKPLDENGYIPWGDGADKIIFQHPFDNDKFIYNHDDNDYDGYNFTYIFSISRGIEYYKHYYCDGSFWTSDEITLLDFTVGE